MPTSPFASLDVYQFLDAYFSASPAWASAFPGNWHAGRAPDNTPMPYLTMNVIGEVPCLHTEDDAAEGVVARFAVVAKSLPECRNLTRMLARDPAVGLDRIADAPLGDGETVATASRQGGATVLDESPGYDGGQAWLGMLTYHFLLSRE